MTVLEELAKIGKSQLQLHTKFLNMKGHCHKIGQVKDLSEGHPDRRKQFCKTLIDMSNAHHLLVKNIASSVEVRKILTRTVNRLNHIYYLYTAKTMSMT